jgi:hypothetical protein
MSELLQTTLAATQNAAAEQQVQQPEEAQQYQRQADSTHRPPSAFATSPQFNIHPKQQQEPVSADKDYSYNLASSISSFSHHDDANSSPQCDSHRSFSSRYSETIQSPQSAAQPHVTQIIQSPKGVDITIDLGDDFHKMHRSKRNHHHQHLKSDTTASSPLRSFNLDLSAMMQPNPKHHKHHQHHSNHYDKYEQPSLDELLRKYSTVAQQFEYESQLESQQHQNKNELNLRSVKHTNYDDKQVQTSSRSNSSNDGCSYLS